jgi:hypothetical protein
MAMQTTGELATVLKKRNVVEIYRVMGTIETEIPPATMIYSGDKVKTGAASFASVLFLDDKSLIKLRENSEIEFIESPNTRTINTEGGKLLFEISSQRTKDFRIQTPISVASVKGTVFWLISGEGVDKVYTEEGTVELFNGISGEFINIPAGNMGISTSDGALLSVPFSSDELPEDVTEEEETIEETVPEGGEEIPVEEEEAPTEEETGMVPPEVPGVPPAGEPGEVPPEEEEGAPGERPYSMGLGIGSTTIDGVIYNQFALRPEVSIGKLGIGLDVVLYIDENGNIRKNEWDEFSDYVDKIYYIRWGQLGDPLYVKFGGLESMTFGYGILMDGYSNLTEYPQVRKVGTHLGLQFGKLGVQGFIANWKEISGPGLFGTRSTYTLSKSFPLTFGVSFVGDGNVYKGLKDSDGDGYPDLLEDFPEDGKYSIDSDNDGLADTNPLEFDRNGDGFPDDNWEGYQEFTGLDSATIATLKSSDLANPTDLKNEPFNVKKKKSGIYSASVDVGYPLLNMKFFNVFVYAQGAKIFGSHKDLSGNTLDHGMGISAPGIRIGLLKLVNLSFEYRYSTENFVYNFFNQNYDFERVQLTLVGDELRPLTKAERLLSTEALQGFWGGLNVNLLGFGSISGSYMNMWSQNDVLQTFQVLASVNADKIPKLSDATAFYQRNNDENPFDFTNPSENTVLGYRIGFGMGGGVTLTWNFYQTYRDLDGNGKIDPETETVKLTTIETGFSF